MNGNIISIIMPVYNQETQVERMIQSIQNQTYRQWELLIIDDGSQDETVLVCSKYVSKESKIHLYIQKHQGQAIARNFGLKKAIGDYIVFADSDDFMHPDMLKVLMENLLISKAELSICGFWDMRNRLSKQNYDGRIEKREFQLNHDSKNGFEVEMKENVYLWNKLYQKKLFENLQFAPHRNFEDFAVMHQIFDRCETVVFDNQKLYYYDMSPNSTMLTIDEKKINDYFWATKQRLAFYRKKKWKTDEKCLTNSFLYQVYDYYETERKKKEKESARRKRLLQNNTRKLFREYHLLTNLPFHGRIRAFAFIYVPFLYEGYSMLKNNYTRLFVADKK